MITRRVILYRWKNFVREEMQAVISERLSICLREFQEDNSESWRQKMYIVLHSKECAFAARVAKYLMEKGVKVRESIMLVADAENESDIEKKLSLLSDCCRIN